MFTALSTAAIQSDGNDHRMVVIKLASLTLALDHRAI